MGDPKSATAEVYSGAADHENYGLHAGALGPLETLAQSVSAMAPSTSPSLTIPLVFALAGNATWFVYLLATGATLLVGFCVSRFARLSASPGSLYTYTARYAAAGLRRYAAWALLLAYLATGASVAGGALYYTNLLSQQFLHWTPPSLLALVVVCAAAGLVAYRDVKLSAELMLWIEVCSVSLICHRPRGHAGPLRTPSRHRSVPRCSGVSLSSLGPALVLSMFSFVGFESATTLGGEARNPLRTIPRAVIQCAILAGVFFVLCSYSEVLGFRGESGKLSDTTSPLHLLADKAGVSPLGTGIDFGAFISMVACVLACVTAASRVLMRMATREVASGSIRENQLAPWHSGYRGCVLYVRGFHTSGHDGHARRERIRRVRPGGIAFGVWLSHRICPGGRGAALCAASTRPALALRRSGQRGDGSCSCADCGVRFAIYC